jgi:hypothetical protein
MTCRKLWGLALGLGVVAVAFAVPSQSQAGCVVWDCLFGAAPCSQTTYASPYTPAPVYSAPATYCAPACQSYVPCATPCATPCAAPCAPQTCNYATSQPYYAYSPVAYTAYQPVAYTAYQPVVGVYPLTTYRPFLGTYQTRLVPYTTYRAYYAPAISYGYSVAPSCGPCGYSSCDSCGSIGCGSVGCGSTGCGSVVYGAPSSSCGGCGSGSTVISSPAASSSGSAPATFKETKKPDANGESATKANEDLKPTPETPTTPSSTTPVLRDPNDRTASRVTNSSARVQVVGRRVETAPVAEDSGWHPAKN